MELADLQAAVDDPDAVIYVRDAAGRYVWVNDNYARLLPFTREQIMGKTNQQLYGAEAAANWESGDALTTASKDFVVTTERLFDTRTRRHRKFVSTKVYITLGGQPHLAGISVEISRGRSTNLELALGKLRARFIAVMNREEADSR